ncbi:CWC16 protein [Chytriomyces sp. MP71]|nr:CWC16 protein [Chytriomyces sp. MP71]
MSERKVLNKYFPPDFDPAKIPRRKMAADAQHKVRLMAPFSMRCSTCGDYVYKGKKFNARKERVEGETYLGIMIFRFYIRCPRCSAEITFKTDPKNTDYVCEHGAQRNFEPWREETEVTEAQKKEKEAAEENNPMKALENRTIDSKREMDILDALDEIRTKNAGNERVDVDAVLSRLQDAERDKVRRILKQQEDEDEAAARAVFHSASDGLFVRRLLEDDDEESLDGGASLSSKAAPLLHVDALDSMKPVASVSNWNPATKVPSKTAAKRDSSEFCGLSVVAKSKKAKSTALTASTAMPDKGISSVSFPAPTSALGISALAAYGSDNEDSS